MRSRKHRARLLQFITPPPWPLTTRLRLPGFAGQVGFAAAGWLLATGSCLLLNQSQFPRLGDGFEAVAIQHELDHLDGVLFLDRVSSLKTDVFRRKG